LALLLLALLDLLTLEDALALFWATTGTSELDEESESLSELDSCFLAFFFVSSFLARFLDSSMLCLREGTSEDEALTFLVDLDF